MLASVSSELSLARQALEETRGEDLARRDRDSALQAKLEELSAKLDHLSFRQNLLTRRDGFEFQSSIVAPLLERAGASAALDDGYHVLLARRDATLLVLFLAPDDPLTEGLGGLDPISAIKAALDGSFRQTFIIVPDGRGRTITHQYDEFLTSITKMPSGALAWAQARKPASNGAKPDTDYFTKLDGILKDLERLDFHALGSAAAGQAGPGNIIPFDKPTLLPPARWAEPARNSALLLHNNYYHYNCLASGLRNRGWDVVTVSAEAPDSPQRQFYHGEDVNLFDEDPAAMLRKTREFFQSVPERYGSLHFYGQGCGSFFPTTFEHTESPQLIPWDFLELRRHRMVIGYMPSGCLDGGLQSSIRHQAENVCGRCVWELRPDICNDAKNLAWNRQLSRLCDWVGLEGDHATPERIGTKTVYGPIVTALDPDRWHPEIAVPPEMQIERAPGETLIYHAVGNYAVRRDASRDIKGTGAVLAAIDRLKAEGLPVQLIFAHDVSSTRVRFLQVQADIVIDQLNYGRYGANAREALMLGKPTICHLNPAQASPLPPLRPILEAPLVNANETTITDTLRALVLAPERRLELGRRGRAFALAWHGQDAAAEKYERIVKRIRDGLPPETPDLYPPSVL